MRTWTKESRTVFLTAVVVLMAITGIGVSGLLAASITLSSSGSIKAINVETYSDIACTQPISSIDWGVPEPGDSVSRNIYVKNSGNADMTLALIVNSWVPAGASSYMTVSWDRQGYVLSADGVVLATITLDVSSSISGIDDFSFQLVIEGTG